MTKKNRRGSVEGSSQDVLGPLQDLIRQLRSGARTKEELVDFNEGRNPFQKKAEAIALAPFKYDKSADGWKLLEDVPFSGVFTPDFMMFLKPGESSVNGDIMRARAKKLNVSSGQRDLEWLEANQHLIPESERGYYLVAPGTVWRDGDGSRGVPYLLWDGHRWGLRWHWLDDDWDGHDRLVSLRK